MTSKEATKEEVIALGQEIWDIMDGWIHSDDGWDFCEEKSEVKMYKRKVDAKKGVHEKGNVIKGVGFVAHAKLEEFVKLVLDPEERKCWDDCDFYDVVTTLDDATDVCHVGVPSYGPISARDFVSVRRSVLNLEEGHYTAVQTYIDYPLGDRTSLVKNHVRGKLLPSCWKFVQREGGCDAYYISGVQLGGWMPQAMVDKFVYSNTYGTFFPNVRKVFLKRHQEGGSATNGKDSESAAGGSKKQKEDEETAEALGKVELSEKPKKKKKKSKKESENHEEEPSPQEEEVVDE